MNHLIRIINSLDYKELKAIQKDLAEGNMGKLVAEKISNLEKSTGFDNKVCPTCGNKINEKVARYTLIFGPGDFKKKASFCGHDCLTFFIEKINLSEKDFLKQ